MNVVVPRTEKFPETAKSPLRDTIPVVVKLPTTSKSWAIVTLPVVASILKSDVSANAFPWWILKWFASLLSTPMVKESTPPITYWWTGSFAKTFCLTAVVIY